MVDYRMISFFRVGAANLWKIFEKQTTGSITGYSSIHSNLFPTRISSDLPQKMARLA